MQKSCFLSKNVPASRVCNVCFLIFNLLALRHRGHSDKFKNMSLLSWVWWLAGKGWCRFHECPKLLEEQWIYRFWLEPKVNIYLLSSEVNVSLWEGQVQRSSYFTIVAKKEGIGSHKGWGSWSEMIDRGHVSAETVPSPPLWVGHHCRVDISLCQHFFNDVNF